MKIKVLFDKDSLDNKLASGWGISFLLGDDFLFDTGENGEYLLKNMTYLGVKSEDIKIVFLSQSAWNHCAGLNSLLELNNNLQVIASSDVLKALALKNCKIKPVDNSQEIAPNIFTSGCMAMGYKDKQGKEQALFIKTKQGITIISGCACQGILNLVNKAKELFPQESIYAVIGGFHLIEKEKRLIYYLAQELKKMEVLYLGPSHCSGYEAISIFKEIYLDNFIDIKVGREIVI